MGMPLPFRGAMFLPYRLIDAALLHPAALTQFVRPLLALFCEPQQRLDCLSVGNTASQPVATLCCLKQPVYGRLQLLWCGQAGGRHLAALTSIMVGCVG